MATCLASSNCDNDAWSGKMTSGLSKANPQPADLAVLIAKQDLTEWKFPTLSCSRSFALKGVAGFDKPYGSAGDLKRLGPLPRPLHAEKVPHGGERRTKSTSCSIWSEILHHTASSVKSCSGEFLMSMAITL